MAEKKTATKAVKKAPAKKVAKKAAAPAKKAVAKKAAAPAAKKVVAKKETKKIIKDAGTGQTVSKEFAQANPKTTMAITVPVDKTPNINEAAEKRAKAAKKATKKAVPAKKAVAKKAPAKKAAKQVAGDKKNWRDNPVKPTQAFGKSFGSLESAAAASHLPLETMQARVASKDSEFSHVKYGVSKQRKK